MELARPSRRSVLAGGLLAGTMLLAQETAERLDWAPGVGCRPCRGLRAERRDAEPGPHRSASPLPGDSRVRELAEALA
jgi:hypothetical protein